MRGVVVTGTDTGVGKTLVSALFVEALRLREEAVGYWKIVQTGWPADDDAEQLRRWLGRSIEVHPSLCRHRMPASPWEAALPGRIRLRRPVGPPRDSLWVAEGAGGLLVPVTARTTLIDLFADLEAPLVVVARPDVGTINHSLLTLEVARSRGLSVAALVFSGEPTEPVRRIVGRLGGCPTLVVPRIRRLTGPSVRRAAAQLASWDWEQLWKKVSHG